MIVVKYKIAIEWYLFCYKLKKKKSVLNNDGEEIRKFNIIN